MTFPTLTPLSSWLPDQPEPRHPHPIPVASALPPPRTNPWQILGRRFEPTDDPDQAQIRSGLAWSVAKVRLRTEDLDPVPDAFAIRRSDLGSILGIVGRDYHPLQNQTIFTFFRDLAGGRKLHFETAGTFHGGRTVWVQARLPDLDLHLGDDQSQAYLLIANGHVGNRLLTIAPTTIRVICQNTLAMAEAQAARSRRQGGGLAGGFQVRHTAGMAAALQDIREAYAATIRNQKATLQAWTYLASVPRTVALERSFFAQVFGRPGPDEADRAQALRKAREARLQAILASPTSQVPGTKDTAFSLLQAVVEYIDHDRPTRTEGTTSATEARLVSATHGSGARLKEAAWTSMLDLTHA